MKKAFELFLVLIIFYGVYSAFSNIAPNFVPDLSEFWVAIISLLVAAGLLLLYSGVIAAHTQKKIALKTSKMVSELEEKVHTKEEEIEQKDSELKNAFKIKHAVEREAEETIQK